MNVEAPLTAALLLASVAVFAISARSLCQRGLAFGYATFIGGVSAAGSRLREIGRRDVYVFCLDDLLPCGKHSSQWRFIIQ